MILFKSNVVCDGKEISLGIDEELPADMNCLKMIASAKSETQRIDVVSIDKYFGVIYEEKGEKKVLASLSDDIKEAFFYAMSKIIGNKMNEISKIKAEDENSPWLTLYGADAIGVIELFGKLKHDLGFPDT